MPAQSRASAHKYARQQGTPVPLIPITFCKLLKNTQSHTKPLLLLLSPHYKGVMVPSLSCSNKRCC